MRILWLAHLVPYPPKGGVQQRSYNLLRELSRHHDVDVVAFRQAAHQPDAAALREAVDHMSGFCRMLAVLPLPFDGSKWRRVLLASRALPGPMKDVSRVLNHHNIESTLLLRRARLEPSALRAWSYRQEGQRLAQYESQTASRFAAHLVCSSLDGDRLQDQCRQPLRLAQVYRSLVEP